MAVKNRTLRETVQYLRLVEKKTAKEVEQITGVKRQTQYGYIQPERVYKSVPVVDAEGNPVLDSEGRPRTEMKWQDNPNYRKTREGLYKTSTVRQRNIKNARRRQLRNRDLQSGSGKANGVDITDAFVEEFVPAGMTTGQFVDNPGVLVNARTNGSERDIINFVFEGTTSTGEIRDVAFNVELIGLPAGDTLFQHVGEINEEIFSRIIKGEATGEAEGSDPLIELTLIKATFMSIIIKGAN